MRNLQPKEYLHHLRKMLRMLGRQLRKSSARRVIADRPTGPDPCSRNSNLLQKHGRSTAKELLTKSRCFHQVDVAEGAVYVIPRSLQRWRWQTHGDGMSKGDWEPATEDELTISADTANMIARSALCNNGRVLADLWSQIGILQGGRAASAAWDLDKWAGYRLHFSTIVGGETAAKYWRSPGCTLMICNCLPFSISGRCEHEQSIDVWLKGEEYMLDTVGQRGRPRGRVTPSFTPRGVSSRVVFGNVQGAKQDDASCGGDISERSRQVGARDQEQQEGGTSSGGRPIDNLTLHPGEATVQRSDASAVPISAPQQATRMGCGSSGGHAVGHNGGGYGAPGPHAPASNFTNYDLVKNVLKGQIMPTGGNVHWNNYNRAT